MNTKVSLTGTIPWMVKNTVASNLLMAVLIVGGLVVGRQLKQEVFPAFELDIVQISVAYPGASPSEVEQGIILAIEEAVRGLDGVMQVNATALENAGSVNVELLLGVDPQKALSDIKNAIDRVTSFPAEAERPVVSVLSTRNEVISIAVYGQHDEEVLRQAADKVRDDLLAKPGITLVELDGVRAREISVEVPRRELRKHGLTLKQVAAMISRSSLDLPGGNVKTRDGEVLLRTATRRDYGQEFGAIPLLNSTDGAPLLVRDIAVVSDTFQDTDESAAFDGLPALMVKVYRVGDQTPIEVSDLVHRYLESSALAFSPGIKLAALDDRSQMYRDRIDLLGRNLGLGLVLVLLTLGLFLEVRLAFWVTMGIPISFFGAFLVMPAMDVSINMVSLFAFIICLGIVVDDAIVVGENIYELKEKGYTPLEAAMHGAKQIALPVTFSVLTTVVAFFPLFMVPGSHGKVFRVIPSIVVSVLLISLVESLFVLPAHLGHKSRLALVAQRFFGFVFGGKSVRQTAVWGVVSSSLQRIEVFRRRFGQGLHAFIHGVYGPFLERAVRYRYVAVATGFSVLIMTLGYIASGRIDFTPMPKVDSDVIKVQATLPFGTPLAKTVAVRDRLETEARALLKTYGSNISRGMFSRIGSASSRSRARSNTGGHLATISLYLRPSDERSVSSARFAQEWRDRVQDLEGVESLAFDYSTGPGAGPSMSIELSHKHIETLEVAAVSLGRTLSTYRGVRDIDDGFSQGKPQLDFEPTAEGQSLGLTADELGRQVRDAFFGAEALRQQRGRDELRVMVRLPKSERGSLHDVESLLVRTPEGGELPLYVAARVERGKSYTMIRRIDGRRVVVLTADTIQGVANAEKIQGSLRAEVLPSLKAEHPGLGYAFGGESRNWGKSLAALRSGAVMAMIVIFALLAIPFRSYAQPAVVMTAVPFGVVGAVGGHILMGYDLSIISVMGIVAVSGIVVNDSLVLVHAANAARENNMRPIEAIQVAAKRRFRPIVLTSLTTFLGLAPMIFEASVQARFLIPMAISLGFGVLFATVIILVMVPSLYMIVEDLTLFVFGPKERSEPVAAFESS